MAEEYYSLVTDFCTQKQLKCFKEGIPFEVFEIALGDGNGNYYEPETTQTELVNEVWRGLVAKCEWSDDKFYCIATVPAEIGGFVAREAGVFDKDNKLLVISKIPETFKQSPDSGTIKQLTIRIELQLTNKELAQLIINPNIDIITRDEMNKLKENFNSTFQAISEKGIPNGYAPIGEDGLIPHSFIPEIETKSILTPFCLNSCRLDSKGNPNLLSCETVQVKKYTSSNLGVFFTDLNSTLEKDAIVYSDTELSVIAGTIVAVDTTALTIAFGVIETLSEFEDEPLHYYASITGDFYVKETLAVGVECFSDIEFSNSIGVVTYLNLTKISIGNDEIYTEDGNITTHIYITAHAPFTYTTAASKTHNVKTDLIIDVVDLCPTGSLTQNFNLFVSEDVDGYSLVALSNQIFTQMLEPVEHNVNDIWFKVLEPLASYIFLLNIWQETSLVPVGVFILEGEESIA